MKPRVLMVHGWGGSPEKDWFPWVKKELENRGYEVVVPEMPDTDYPKIKPWVQKLTETMGLIRQNDTFIGHSIGCQAVLRYLQTVPPGTQFHQGILIAPWVVLTQRTFAEMGEDESVVKSWYEEPIEYGNIKGMAKWTAVFSDDDPFVDFNENQQIFRDQLGAEISLFKHQGHFAFEQGIRTIPFLLDMVGDSCKV